MTERKVYHLLRKYKKLVSRKETSLNRYRLAYIKKALLCQLQKKIQNISVEIMQVENVSHNYMSSDDYKIIEELKVSGNCIYELLRKIEKGERID